jgi:hypothetical protein
VVVHATIVHDCTGEHLTSTPPEQHIASDEQSSRPSQKLANPGHESAASMQRG